MKIILAAAVLICTAFGTSLTGTLNNPDGTGATGTLYLSLSQQAALSAAGGCGTATQILPTVQIAIKVSSGSLVSPPNIFGNDCLLPNGTYYNVSFSDSNGNQLFTDRWLIQGNTQNLGSIVSVVISGTTQTLGGVGIVQTIPTATQTVTQPPSTVLNVNLLGATTAFTMPDTSVCNTTNCTFAGAVGFLNGFNTGSGGIGNLYIGTGNFYNRAYPGVSSNICSGVANGWQAVDTTNFNLLLCIGNTTYVFSPTTHYP